MSVNFKVGFTISGETLFALIAKMLPIENLEGRREDSGAQAAD